MLNVHSIEESNGHIHSFFQIVKIEYGPFTSNLVMYSTWFSISKAKRVMNEYRFKKKK